MPLKSKRTEEDSPVTMKKSKRAEKLSLQPIEFEDALASLLATPPPIKPALKKKVGQKKPTTKKRAK